MTKTVWQRLIIYKEGKHQLNFFLVFFTLKFTYDSKQKSSHNMMKTIAQ